MIVLESFQTGVAYELCLGNMLLSDLSRQTLIFLDWLQSPEYVNVIQDYNSVADYLFSDIISYATSFMTSWLIALINYSPLAADIFFLWFWTLDTFMWITHPLYSWNNLCITLTILFLGRLAYLGSVKSVKKDKNTLILGVVTFLVFCVVIGCFG